MCSFLSQSFADSRGPYKIKGEKLNRHHSAAHGLELAHELTPELVDQRHEILLSRKRRIITVVY